MALFRRKEKEPAPKQFAPVDIQPDLAPPVGCFATDRITVDGEPVGYMVHDPDGWQFFAGDEDEAYTSDPDKIGIYSLNTIASYDPTIVPYLDAAMGTAWLRSESGFVPDVDGQPDAMNQIEGLHPGFPAVDGRVTITDDWAITLPRPMNRRFEDGSVVLWIPELITIWLFVPPPGSEVRPLTDEHPENRGDTSDVRRWQSGALSALSYRVNEPADDERRPPLTCLAYQPGTRLTMSVYFDDENEASLADELAHSLESMTA